jgi:cytidylate kinase
MQIVTVSRMYGSGGSEVAAKVAEKLGWPLLDNEFVEEVAQRLGISPAEVSAREERVSSAEERLATTLAMTTGEFVIPGAEVMTSPTEEQMLQMTQKVITDAVAKGPVVLVGRGAQMQLAQRADAVHAFCYAPRAALVARAMARHRCSKSDAEHIVDDMNKNRQEYVKKHWKRSWSAHENYHICVNTEWLGIEGAADLIAELARGHGK